MKVLDDFFSAFVNLEDRHADASRKFQKYKSPVQKAFHALGAHLDIEVSYELTCDDKKLEAVIKNVKTKKPRPSDRTPTLENAKLIFEKTPQGFIQVKMEGFVVNEQENILTHKTLKEPTDELTDNEVSNLINDFLIELVKQLGHPQ